jgi:hypothetical protein
MISMDMDDVGGNMMRTPQEVATDRLLLLYLIDRANREGDLYGLTKLMKMVFLSECNMIRDRVKGFNYSFYRWYLGAFTPEIYQDLDHLIWNDLVTERARIELTERGRIILDAVDELLKENGHILRYIDELIEKLANKGVQEIMEMAYKTKVMIPPPFNMEVEMERAPSGFPLINKIDELEADRMLLIDEGWLETLDILLDKEAYESAKAAISSSRIERSEKIEL